VKLVRDPFIQFLFAGIALYALFAFTAAEDPALQEHDITVDAATLDWMHRNFVKQMRRPPTPGEMDTLVRTHIEHEIKYREALAMGLDERDSIVQRRLVQKFDFLFGEGAAQADPGDDVLKKWYEDNRERFSLPSIVSFEHYWFSPDRRGEQADIDAQDAATALNQGNAVEGDPFPFEVNYRDARIAEVRGIFGVDFATAVLDAPLDEWIAPVQSGLGQHAIRVTARTAGETPPLADIRAAVLDEWRRAENQRILEQTVAEVLDDYTISIDENALQSLNFTPEPTGAAP
jgi:hypothetical protein